MNPRKSNRKRKETDRLDPSHIVMQKSNAPNDKHQVSDNSSYENGRSIKKLRSSVKSKQVSRLESKLLLDDSAGIYPSDDEDGYYFAEDVVARRQTANGAWKYRVRWLGYDARHDTWEPEENLNEYLKECVRRRFLLRQNDPLTTPEQQEEVDRALAETKEYTDYRNEKLRRKGLPLDDCASSLKSNDDTISSSGKMYGCFDKDYNPDDVADFEDDDDISDVVSCTDIFEEPTGMHTQQLLEYPCAPHELTPDMNRKPPTSGKMFHRPPSSILHGKYVGSRSSGFALPEQARASSSKGKTLNSDGTLMKSMRRTKTTKTNKPRRDTMTKSRPMEVAIIRKIAQIAKRSKIIPTNCSEERIKQIEQILDMLNVLLEESGFCEQTGNGNPRELSVEAVNRDASYITPEHRVIHRDHQGLRKFIDTAPDRNDAFNPSNHRTSDQVDVNVLDGETNSVACVTHVTTSEGLKDPSLRTTRLHPTKFQQKQQEVPAYCSNLHSDDDIDDQTVTEGYLTQDEEPSNIEQKFVSHSDSRSFSSCRLAHDSFSESDTGW